MLGLECSYDEAVRRTKPQDGPQNFLTFSALRRGSADGTYSNLSTKNSGSKNIMIAMRRPIWLGVRSSGCPQDEKGD